VIELDGPVHDSTEEYDQFRESELINLGIHIIRFKNEELTELDQIKEKILAFLNSIS
jgi:very-short-patch-repair endonuclease